MNYKLKVNKENVRSVLEHLEEINFYAHDSIYEYLEIIKALNIEFENHLHGISFWTNLELPSDPYALNDSKEITVEQLLKMSFEDLEKGNIPGIELKIDNLIIQGFKTMIDVRKVEEIIKNNNQSVDAFKLTKEDLNSNIGKLLDLSVIIQNGKAATCLYEKCSSCETNENCSSLTIVSVKDFIKKHEEKNMDAFYDPNSQEELKLGDEVYINGKIVKDYRDDDFLIQLNSLNHQGEKREHIASKNEIYKSIPNPQEEQMKKLAEIEEINEKADIQTIENVKEYFNNISDAFGNGIVELQKFSKVKNSSSVMLGEKDLSKRHIDDIDDDDDMYGRTE